MSAANNLSVMVASPVRGWYERKKMHVELEGGRIIHFPIKGNPKLEGATPEQLNHVRMLPFGLHWPDVDEHLSIEVILQGITASKRRKLRRRRAQDSFSKSEGLESFRRSLAVA